MNELITYFTWKSNVLNTEDGLDGVLNVDKK